MTKKIGRAIALLGVFAGLALFATGCGQTTIYSASDQYLCAYGDAQHGQHLEKQLPPGAQPISVSNWKASELARIPTSNRFYDMSLGRARDPGAPSSLETNARGSVRILVQMQVRFRFNQEKICQWYEQHGRRNTIHGDLGFNARGPNQANTGWEKWLAENFATTAQQALDARTANYDWTSLVYNYPQNADSSGIVKGKAGELMRTKFGNDIAQTFQKDLAQNLGDQYFCGTSSRTGCPPLLVQIEGVRTVNQTLMTNREQVEVDRQNLANTAAENAIGAQLLQHEALQKKILAAEISAGQLQAARALLQAQVKDAACLVRAKYGLDCAGNRSNSVTVNTGKP